MQRVRLSDLATTLAPWFPENTAGSIDAALTAMTRNRPLFLDWQRPHDLAPLIRAIHAATDRRLYPLTFLDIPNADATERVRAQLTDTSGGMLVVDLWTYPAVPRTVCELLFQAGSHIWPVFLGPSMGHVYELFEDMHDWHAGPTPWPSLHPMRVAPPTHTNTTALASARIGLAQSAGKGV